jgi:hypothetical protein
MPEILIREATQEDVDYVADHLRAADVHELSLSQPDEPAAAVKASFGYSNWTKCALVDGVPTVLYGVSPTDIPECGTPWMLATNDIYKIKQEFLAGSKSEVDEMQLHYRFLFNQVHKDNKTSIRWLMSLGFAIDLTPTGPHQEFFNFWLGVPNV